MIELFVLVSNILIFVFCLFFDVFDLVLIIVVFGIIKFCLKSGESVRRLVVI